MNFNAISFKYIQEIIAGAGVINIWQNTNEFNDLPADLILKVFLSCDLNSVLNSQRVSKGWNKYTQHPELWRSIAKRIPNFSKYYSGNYYLSETHSDTNIFNLIDQMKQKGFSGLAYFLNHMPSQVEFHTKKILTKINKESSTELVDLFNPSRYSDLYYLEPLVKDCSRSLIEKIAKGFKHEWSNTVEGYEKRVDGSTIHHTEKCQLFSLDITELKSAVGEEKELILVYPHENEKYKKLMVLKFKPSPLSVGITYSSYYQDKSNGEVHGNRFWSKTIFFENFCRLVEETFRQEIEKFHESED